MGAESQILNETGAFGGLSSIQGDIRADKDVGNTLIGSLFANKKRKSNISTQAQLRKTGKQVSNLVNFNTKKKNDAFASSDILGQQNNLSQSGFNYDDLQFGKSGMKLYTLEEKKEKHTKYKPPTN